MTKRIAFLSSDQVQELFVQNYLKFCDHLEGHTFDNPEVFLFNLEEYQPDLVLIHYRFLEVAKSLRPKGIDLWVFGPQDHAERENFQWIDLPLSTDIFKNL